MGLEAVEDQEVNGDIDVQAKDLDDKPFFLR